MINTVVINSLLNTYSKSGQPARGLTLLEDIIRLQIQPDGQTIKVLLDICVIMKDVTTARKIQKLISNPALRLLANVINCTRLISVYAHHGLVSDAMSILSLMDSYNIEPDSFVYTGLMQACANASSLQEALHLHKRLQASSYPLTAPMQTALINMFTKCGAITTAASLFNEMRQSNLLPNMKTWTAMISGYVQHGHNNAALALFDDMQTARVPPGVATYTSALSACANLRDSVKGEQLALQIKESGMLQDEMLQTSLLQMYAKCGNLAAACNIFSALRTHSADSVTWNIMMTSFEQSGQNIQVLELFEEMIQRGIPLDDVSYNSALTACANLKNLTKGKEIHAQLLQRNKPFTTILSNALLNLYSKCDSLESAHAYFKNLQKTTNLMDSATWTTMIATYLQHERPMDSLRLFQQMQSKNIPLTEFTYVTVLSACAEVGALTQGKTIHQEILKKGSLLSDGLTAALITLYAKCGQLYISQNLFDNALPSNLKSLILWNAMIGAYACNGTYLELDFDFLGKSALAESVLNKMEQYVHPDARSCSALLTAYSHCGMVEEAKQFLHNMPTRYNITPSLVHYSCIVDALARAGHLEDAERFIHSLPMNELNVITWMSLLAGCVRYSDVARAERAAESALKLVPKKASVFVLLANLYAEVGDQKGAERIRQRMVDLNIKKIPGISYTELNGELVSFVVEDKSHPLTNEIYALSDTHHHEVLKLGYKPDTTCVLRDVPQHMKELLLRRHRYLL